MATLSLLDSSVSWCEVRHCRENSSSLGNCEQVATLSLEEIKCHTQRRGLSRFVTSCSFPPSLAIIFFFILLFHYRHPDTPCDVSGTFPTRSMTTSASNGVQSTVGTAAPTLCIGLSGMFLCVRFLPLAHTPGALPAKSFSPALHDGRIRRELIRAARGRHPVARGIPGAPQLLRHPLHHSRCCTSINPLPSKPIWKRPRRLPQVRIRGTQVTVSLSLTFSERGELINGIDVSFFK
jgi:hypothetical protein